MNKIVIGTITFAVLLLSVINSTAQIPVTVGGYSDASTEDADVIAAARFAVREKNKGQKERAIELISIKRAAVQVVAGMNFRLCLEIRDGKEARTAQAIVFRSLQQKWSLTSWTAAACDATTEIVSDKTKASTSDISLKKHAAAVVFALKAKNMDKLSKLVHPTKGVRFSPYAYINDKADLVFKPSEVRSLMSNRRRLVWGEADGTGDPIKLTFANYYKRYIYDRDFANAPKVSVNESLGSGNIVYNGGEVFPGSSYVEYYFGGSERYSNMDWKALYLTFEKYEGKWFLVSIAHNEWTT